MVRSRKKQIEIRGKGVEKSRVIKDIARSGAAQDGTEWGYSAIDPVSRESTSAEHMVRKLRRTTINR